MKTKDIIKNENLTIAQAKQIPSLIKSWLSVDHCDTLEQLIVQQTKSFANSLQGVYNADVIKIEKLEWAGNAQGCKNDYDSDITVWVTAIVDLGSDKIVRLGFDLFDSMLMASGTTCSGSVY